MRETATSPTMPDVDAQEYDTTTADTAEASTPPEQRAALQEQPSAAPEQPSAERTTDEGLDAMTSRWQAIQTAFVDTPRDAVRDADALVADAMQQLARAFVAERESLESQWSRGDDVTTEDLRLALQGYRSFLQRLLAA